MRCLVGTAMMAGLCLIGCLANASQASAEVLVVIDKSKQRMIVLVDGVEQHVWKVSTGLGGGPKSGTYRPERLERKWFSRKYGMSPMPHSIFFHEGYAIHGTIYISRLGNRASHGCVRLHPTNAATLFDLVRGQGMANTTIIVSNTEYVVKPDAQRQASDSIHVPETPPIAPAAHIASGVTASVAPPSVPPVTPQVDE